MTRFVLIAALAACGGKADDCERIVSKVASAMPSELPTGQSHDELVAKCRKRPEKLNDPGVQCILAADGDDAVRACITKSMEDERAKRAQAEAAAQAAVRDAQEAKDKLDKIAADLDELNKRVNQAVDDVAQAKSKADREAAAAKLKQLQADKQQLEARIAQAKADAAKAERAKGVHISPECLKNPLAKGCS